MISLDNGWFIEYNPKPIPSRFGVDWDFWHKACDPSDGHDGLCGVAASAEAAKEQIEDIEAEHVYFQEVCPTCNDSDIAKVTNGNQNGTCKYNRRCNSCGDIWNG